MKTAFNNSMSMKTLISNVTLKTPELTPELTNQLDEVKSCLEQLNSASRRLHFIRKLLNKYKSEIYTNGFHFLKPIIAAEFPDEDNIGWICILPNDKKNARNVLIVSKQYDFLQGTFCFDLGDTIRAQHPGLQENSAEITKYYYSVIKNNKEVTELSVQRFNNGGDQLQINMFLEILGIQYVIGAVIELKYSTEVTSTFKNFLNKINKILTEESTDRFQYGLPFESLKCIKSQSNSEWNDRLISKCFVRDSDENIPLKYELINTQLSFILLNVGQRCFIVYPFENKTRVSIVTICPNDTYYEKSIILNDYFNPLQIKNTNTFDEVNDCFKELKKKINYVYDLKQEINKNITQIELNGFEKVLRPIFRKKFPLSDNYFWVTSYPKDITQSKVEFEYSIHFDYLSGQYIYDMKPFDKNITENAISLTKYYHSKTNTQEMKESYDISIHKFVDSDGIVSEQLYFNIFLKIKKIWFMLTSSVELKRFFPSTSPAFNNFISVLSKLVNGSNDTNEGDQFEFGEDFSSLKCISSQLNSEWDGQKLSQCFLPWSNENTPQMYESINSQLLSYSIREIGQKCIVPYQFQQESCIAVITILSMNTYKLISLRLKDYFSMTVNKGDTINQGTFTVTGADGHVALHADPSTNVTCFYEKVGINQNAYEVNAILDIDTNSTQQITMVNDTIRSSMTTLYDSIQSMTTDGVIEYKKTSEFTVFTVPIQEGYKFNTTEYSNTAVQLEYVNIEVEEGNIIQMDIDSFRRIQTINNELFYGGVVKNQVYTFIELINDTMHNYLAVMTAFKEGDRMRFISVFTNVDFIMNDDSLSKRFRSVVEQYSGMNRSLNYASTIVNDSKFTYKINTGIIPRFGKFFCFSNKPEIMDDVYLFHEQYTYWNGEQLNQLYIGDYKVIDVAQVMLSQYKSIYGSTMSQNCLIDYMWVNGLRVTFLRKIMIDDIPYMLCIGMNLVDYLVPSIHSRGDSTLSGNFTVQDESKNVIFQIDNYEKNIKHLYNVGIGTPFPSTTLDIEDFGVDDIIHFINDTNIFSRHAVELLPKLRDVDMNDINAIKLLFGGFKEDNNQYFSILSYDDFTQDTMQWLYRKYKSEWRGYSFNELLEQFPEDSTLLNTAITINTNLSKSYMFDGSKNYVQFDWAFGLKQGESISFLNKGNWYALNTGRNIQSYNLKANTNKNIKRFFNCHDNYNNYLQYIRTLVEPSIAVYKRNIDALYELVHSSQKLFPLKTYTVYEISPIPLDSIVRIYSFPDRTLLTEKKVQETNNVLKTKSLSFIYKYNKTGIENGRITFEDKLYNYVSLFFTLNGLVYSIEIRIEDYIKPTVDIKGDFMVQGNLIVYDKYAKQQYSTIDPASQFFGINTDDRTIYYNKNYATTNQIGAQLAKHHVYITKDTYPNLVCERINDKVGTYQKSYSTYSAATMKRDSNTNTFQQMVDETEKNNAFLTTHGVGKNMYGVDISFEISDSTKLTQEIGNIAMGIDSLEGGAIQAGFSVNVRDPVPFKNEFIPRNILHVDNKGCLSVNSLHSLVTKTADTYTLEANYPISLTENATFEISLPEDPMSIQISMEYTEQEDSYFFKTHLKKNQRKTIEPILYPCDSNNKSKSNFKIIQRDKLFLQITTFSLVSMLTIKYGQLTAFDNFELTIKKL